MSKVSLAGCYGLHVETDKQRPSETLLVLHFKDGGEADQALKSLNAARLAAEEAARATKAVEGIEPYRLGTGVARVIHPNEADLAGSPMDASRRADLSERAAALIEDMKTDPKCIETAAIFLASHGFRRLVSAPDLLPPTGKVPAEVLAARAEMEAKFGHPNIQPPAPPSEIKSWIKANLRPSEPEPPIAPQAPEGGEIVGGQIWDTVEELAGNPPSPPGG